MIEPTLVYRLRLASVTLRERYDLVVATWHLNSPLEWPFVIDFRPAQRLFWAPGGRSGTLSLCLSGPSRWRPPQVAPVARQGGGARLVLARNVVVLARSTRLPAG